VKQTKKSGFLRKTSCSPVLFGGPSSGPSGGDPGDARSSADLPSLSRDKGELGAYCRSPSRGAEGAGGAALRLRARRRLRGPRGCGKARVAACPPAHPAPPGESFHSPPPCAAHPCSCPGEVEGGVATGLGSPRVLPWRTGRRPESQRGQHRLTINVSRCLQQGICTQRVSKPVACNCLASPHPPRSHPVDKKPRSRVLEKTHIPQKRALCLCLDMKRCPSARCAWNELVKQTRNLSSAPSRQESRFIPKSCKYVRSVRSGTEKPPSRAGYLLGASLPQTLSPAILNLLP